jgi:hypothetical protein
MDVVALLAYAVAVQTLPVAILLLKPNATRDGSNNAAITFRLFEFK